MAKANAGLVLVLMGALALPAVGSAARAKDGDVIVRAACSGGSIAKLKLSGDAGRIEAEVEVDQNRNGVPWTVALSRDGVRVARVVRLTRAPSGSLTLRRLVANPAGADVIRAVATRRGERCSIRATWTR
jgi:hypothetical protein